MNASSRIVVNTIAQIIKSIVTIIVVLWTSRVVLSNLGVQDYGIYSLVCGVIAVLGFLRISLSSTTQRFLSYYQNDYGIVLKEIFNNSIITQILVGSFICGGLALGTTLIFSYILNIPPDRMESAKIVYWLMLGCLYLNLISIPYVAALISQENIIYTSLVQILESLLKIPIALSLYWISFDKLEWYALLVFSLNFFTFLCYLAYCIFKYDECRVLRIRGFKSSLFKEMFIFSGWDMYGNSCHYLRKQGVAVLLNNFFTVTINAAYGIGHQVASQIEFLSASLMTATKPQIVKAESGKDRVKMIRISEMSNKFSFLLLSVIAIPLAFNMDIILKLWLGIVPPYAEMFCLSFLCITLANVATSSFNTVNLAVGHVKSYNLKVNTIRLAALPLTYLALKMGAKPSLVMLLYFLSEFFCSLERLFFLHRDISYSLRQYIENVAAPCFFAVSVNMVYCFTIKCILPSWGVLVASFGSFLITILIVCRWGIKDDEKSILLSMLSKIRGFLK